MDWALVNNLFGIAVGLGQIVTLALLVKQIKIQNRQLEAQNKQIKIEEENIQFQKRQEYLKQTYQVMETRLLEILKLKYDINVQLAQDIESYCEEKYSIPFNKIPKKNRNKAREEIINKYKNEKTYYLQKKV